MVKSNALDRRAALVCFPSIVYPLLILFIFALQLQLGESTSVLKFPATINAAPKPYDKVGGACPVVASTRAVNGTQGILNALGLNINAKSSIHMHSCSQDNNTNVCCPVVSEDLGTDQYSLTVCQENMPTLVGADASIRANCTDQCCWVLRKDLFKCKDGHSLCDPDYDTMEGTLPYDGQCCPNTYTCGKKSNPLCRYNFCCLGLDDGIAPEDEILGFRTEAESKMAEILFIVEAPFLELRSSRGAPYTTFMNEVAQMINTYAGFSRVITQPRNSTDPDLNLIRARIEPFLDSQNVTREIVYLGVRIADWKEKIQLGSATDLVKTQLTLDAGTALVNLFQLDSSKISLTNMVVIDVQVRNKSNRDAPGSSGSRLHLKLGNFYTYFFTVTIFFIHWIL
eukprot:Nk52_evm9s288 gene=Nk52_evmTU9s288